MSSLVPCFVCGGSDYEIQSGYYICRNCDTQSQDIFQEQSFEYIDAPYVANVDEKEEFISQKIVRERRLTSWECFNIILKGLVDELIELGAQPRLKKTVFQLWALFLQKQQIAFFSKTEEKLPSLPASFKNSDIEVLYGIKSFRQLYYKDLVKMRSSLKTRRMEEPKKCETVTKSNEADADNSGPSKYTRRSLHEKQRKLAEAKLENDVSQQKIEELSDSIMSIGRNRNVKKEVAISFKSSAKEWMDTLKREFEKIKRKYGNDPDKIPQGLQRHFCDRLYCKKTPATETSRMHITINLSLVILRLALFMTEDTIQWADLLRWACEGRLSCFRVQKFLPENGYVKPTSDLCPQRRTHLIHNEMRRLTVLLNMKDIPSPDLFVLIERYTYELCLPNEFLEFTKKIVALFPPQMDYAYFDNRIFPDYECRAMAYILFVSKILFSLDDVTELKQSEFANSINGCNEKTSVEDVAPLFSWTDWTRHVECRKAVLSEYDVTMNNLCESGTNSTDDAFSEYWKNTEPDACDAERCKRLDRNLLTQLEIDTEGLLNHHIDNNGKPRIINFPSSLTPFRTYTQHLTDNYRELLSERSLRILSTDFSSHSIKYLLDSEWCCTIGNKCGVNVNPVFDTAVGETKLFQEPVSNVPRLSKGRIIPAHVPTPVHIVDDPKKKKANKISEEFDPEFKCFDLSRKKKKKRKSCFELHYPSTNYWLFHNMSRLHGEKFSKHARSNLPLSFLWLLQECSRVLRCDLHNLYDELVAVEYAYTCLFSDDYEYSQETSHFCFFSNEW